MTDAWTDELFDVDGVDRLEFPVSRLLVDPERFDQDADEPMAAVGMGAVYTRTHDGKELKTTAARSALMTAYYYPHHLQMEQWVQTQLKVSERCLIIDCHSFPSSPLPCDQDQHANRPDICLGTADPHTPQYLLKAAKKAFEDLGYNVSVDQPYAGTIVPLKWYGKDSRVGSIMVEVNRRLYMDEEKGDQNSGCGRTKADLITCLGIIVKSWEKPA